MAETQAKILNEVEVLSKSIEFVIRNLIKILIGKISLTRLQELIESIFIEESESFLRKEKPGRDVSLTKLALLTGVDTRKLARIRNSATYRHPIYRKRQFLDEFTPESSIIELWASDPRFTNLSTGEPHVLPIWGDEASFEIIVKEALRSRGITVTSIIERMISSNLILVHDSERVELTSKTFRPLELREKIGNIKMGLDSTGHLLATVHHNLEAPSIGENKFFHKGSWTHRLNPLKREQLEQKMRVFLSASDKGVKTTLKEFEEETVNDRQMTAGVVLYYFEAETF